MFEPGTRALDIDPTKRGDHRNIILVRQDSEGWWVIPENFGGVEDTCYLLGERFIRERPMEHTAKDADYSSEDECVLDIIANTDAPYRLAVLAARFVWLDGWSYDNHPHAERGVLVSPDFDAQDPTIIQLVQGNI